MFQVPPVAPVPLVQQVLDKVFVSALVGLIGGAIMWPFRNLKKEWKAATDKLNAVQEELELQRTNHLTHIEQNTAKTVEILEKMHESQIKMTGFLEGRKRV